MHEPSSCTDPDCAGHGRTHQQIQQHLRGTIKRVGWAVIGSLDVTPGYVYTVGLTARRWPELYFTVNEHGTKDMLTAMSNLLNRVVVHHVDAKLTPTHGSTVTLTDEAGATVTCYLETRLNTRPLAKAHSLYRSVRAMEVVPLDPLADDGIIVSGIGTAT